MASKSSSKPMLKISFNSPVILGFSFICLIALILNKITLGTSNAVFFMVYRSSLANPLTYLRMFTHVFGHSGWSHFINNITLLLVVGPLLEEKYGSKNMIAVITTTAFITGLVHFIFFPHTALLGASGVVFAMILLSSFTCIKGGAIPLTFILVAILYIGGQVYDCIFVRDNISNLTHIIGGIVGAGFGYLINVKK
ncbi:MAG: rhomboid family intramembrane serine protease [Coprococcus sp.]